MTVLVEQQQQQQTQQQYNKNEMDAKIFKVLVAFSQNIEKSLINNQNTLHDAENTLGSKVNYQAQAIDSKKLDPTNIGLYTVQLVRNVIKRSDDLSEEFKVFVQEQLEKERQYKEEIQYLKSRVELLQKPSSSSSQSAQQPIQPPTPISSQQSSTVSTPPSNTNKIIEEKLENISLDDDNSNNSTTTTTTTTTNENNTIQNKNLSNVQQQQLSSSPNGSNLSVSSSHLDWDTKYQTELQLNAMLSEFLKDDFEISNSLGVSDVEVSSTSSPAISQTTNNSNVLGSSGSFSPSNASPGLNHSNSSLTLESNKMAPSQKKAMLTDLLDQIDLDAAGGSNTGSGSPQTPSKQKKGKFKFF